jgi:hypothetical protein
MVSYRLASLIYSKFFQPFLGPTNIIRFIGKEKEFMEKIYFLRELNNLDGRFPNHKERITNLEMFVSVGFSKETYLDPKESVFFEYYSKGRLTRFTL